VYSAVATQREHAAVAAQRAAFTGAPAARPPVATPPDAPRVDRAELMRLVRTLADPALEGRRTGSPGSLEARRIIREAFQQIGLRPAGPNADAGSETGRGPRSSPASYDQPFSFSHTSIRGLVSRDRPFRTTYDNAANVVAMEPGTKSGAPAIVVSAHYDHLGRRDGVVYPGADDNASGVAALLAAARYVHAHPLAHPVIFAAFDAEELGLEGARTFMRARPAAASAIALNINFDMVSRNDRNEIFAAGTYHTPSLKPIVDEAQGRTSVKILFGHDRPMTRAGMVEDWTSQSDHGIFHQAGIPFLYFGVEDHPDYHKPTDTADKIEPAFFGNVADMLVDVLLTADRRLR
jgi:hypothetical protein